MQNKLIVNVTAEHIREGKIGNNKLCPIALALLSILKGIELAVYSRSVVFEGRGWAYLPREAFEFISTFDYQSTHKDAKPFTFELVLQDYYGHNQFNLDEFLIN